MKTRYSLALLSLSLLASPSLHAANYPDRPVRIIVGFPAGGPADVAARIMAEGLQKTLKQPFVVENRTGASGIIAAQNVAKATADGYMLLVATNSLTLNALTAENPGYEPERDFAPVALLATQASAVAVSPNLPVNTLADFKQLAGQRKMSFATSGQGTSSQMIGIYLFNTLWKTDMAAVPYRGAGPADMAVASGEPPVSFTTIGGAYHLQQDGRMKILAIANDKRLALLPDVPTMKELGYENFSASWTGLFAPTGTPPAVVGTLNKAVNRLLADPDVRRKFAGQSMDIHAAMDARETQAYMKRESAVWTRLVEATGSAPSGRSQ